MKERSYLSLNDSNKISKSKINLIKILYKYQEIQKKFIRKYNLFNLINNLNPIFNFSTSLMNFFKASIQRYSLLVLVHVLVQIYLLSVFHYLFCKHL